mmetsp:Transcript_43665/g.79657  ORF Transcript_43665/g.79657 Transcript_43665/m.79657 type:complete len:223 (+) Transcript_43665:1734-2402(+)
MLHARSCACSAASCKILLLWLAVDAAVDRSESDPEDSCCRWIAARRSWTRPGFTVGLLDEELQLLLHALFAMVDRAREVTGPLPSGLLPSYGSSSGTGGRWQPLSGAHAETKPDSTTITAISNTGYKTTHRNSNPRKLNGLMCCRGATLLALVSPSLSLPATMCFSCEIDLPTRFTKEYPDHWSHDQYVELLTLGSTSSGPSACRRARQGSCSVEFTWEQSV